MSKLRRSVAFLDSIRRRAQARSKLPPRTELTERIIGALVSDGVISVGLDELELSTDPEFTASVERSKAELLATQTYAEREYEAGFEHCIPINPSRIATEYPALYMWGLNEKLLDMVENILGEPPAYHGAMLRKEITDDNDIGTRRWHFDGEDFHTLRILIYLTDVLTEDDGPFEYIPRSTLRRGEADLNLSTNEEVEKMVPLEEWRQMLGPAGTVIFAAVSNIAHHGAMPKSERVCLSYYYTSRKPLDPDLCKLFSFQSGMSQLNVALSERQYDCLWDYQESFGGPNNMPDHTANGQTLVQRGSSPVLCRDISSFINRMTLKEVTNSGDGNPYMREVFEATYTNWLKGATTATVTGLDQFPVRYYVDGVTQAYDIFFAEHRDRRFRTYAGEYPYTRLSVQNWAELASDELRAGDALVLTMPFYINGAQAPDLASMLDRCLELEIPVFVDAAYFGTCYDVHFDYSHPAITMVGFSLSKTFAVQSYRIGLAFMKQKVPALEEIQIASNYFNRVGAYIGTRLMETYDANYVVDRYRGKHQEVCSELGMTPTQCIMLGSVADDDHRFDDILADERFPPETLAAPLLRRACISAGVSDTEPALRKFVKRLIGRG